MAPYVPWRPQDGDPDAPDVPTCGACERVLYDENDRCTCTYDRAALLTCDGCDDGHVLLWVVLLGPSKMDGQDGGHARYCPDCLAIARSPVAWGAFAAGDYPAARVIGEAIADGGAA